MLSRVPACDRCSFKRMQGLPLLHAGACAASKSPHHADTAMQGCCVPGRQLHIREASAGLQRWPGFCCASCLLWHQLDSTDGTKGLEPLGHLI